MGMDIYIHTTSEEHFEDEPNTFLSRDFCGLMGLEDGEYIFNQISSKSGIDVSALYEMSAYGADMFGSLDAMIEDAETEKEKKKILKADKAAKKKCEGNIERVSLTIDNLIQKIDMIKGFRKDLDVVIDDRDFVEDDYFEVTFLEDLQAIQRFISYHRSKGNTTLFFCYG